MNKVQIIGYALALARNTDGWSKELSDKLVQFDQDKLTEIFAAKIAELEASDPSEFYTKDFIRSQVQSLSEVIERVKAQSWPNES